MADESNRHRHRVVVEFVSAGAVLLGLMFVGLELKRNTAVASAQAVFELNSSVNRGIREIAQDPDSAELFIKATSDIDSLTVNERFRYDLWIRIFLNSNESAWLFHEKGVIESKDYAGWQKGICITMERPGFKEFLADRQNSYAIGFVEDVNERCGL